MRILDGVPDHLDPSVDGEDDLVPVTISPPIGAGNGFYSDTRWTVIGHRRAPLVRP